MATTPWMQQIKDTLVTLEAAMRPLELRLAEMKEQKTFLEDTLANTERLFGTGALLAESVAQQRQEGVTLRPTVTQLPPAGRRTRRSLDAKKVARRLLQELGQATSGELALLLDKEPLWREMTFAERQTTLGKALARLVADGEATYRVEKGRSRIYTLRSGATVGERLEAKKGAQG